MVKGVILLANKVKAVTLLALMAKAEVILHAHRDKVVTLRVLMAKAVILHVHRDKVDTLRVLKDKVVTLLVHKDRVDILRDLMPKAVILLVHKDKAVTLHVQVQELAFALIRDALCHLRLKKCRGWKTQATKNLENTQKVNFLAKLLKRSSGNTSQPRNKKIDLLILGTVRVFAMTSKNKDGVKNALPKHDHFSKKKLFVLNR
jgi:hypothetical protein